MPDHFTQPKDQEPDSFDQDLHPNIGAGINDNDVGANPEQNAIPAYEIKEAHDILDGFRDDELKRIMILPEGSVLEQGATYFDLRHGGRGEFTAERPETVGPANLNMFVPKSVVDYELWNKLRGVNDPERR
jgi:hypothetical protein